MKRFNWFASLVKCIVFALNLSLGINVGFIFDTWLQPVFSGGLEWVGFLVALASGLLIAAGSFGLFIKTEIAAKSIARVQNPIERRLRMGALVSLVLFFVGVGIFGLVYRLEFLNSKGIGFLVIIGILLDCSQPLFGLVLSPIENTPVDLLEEDLSDLFDRRVIQDSFALAGSMPLSRRLEAYSGNFGQAVQTTISEEAERKATPRLPRKSKRHLTGNTTPRALPGPSTSEEEIIEGKTSGQ